MLLERTGLKYIQLAELLGFNRSVLSKIASGKLEISAEYKMRCVERLRRPGYRFNIFWFEDPEKHPFWVPEDYWLNQFGPEFQVLAQMKPDFMEALKRVARLPPEKQERWLNMARDLFNLGEG
ncbi:MAG: helix-turn-helix transcriptional regulator [Leptospiraceae bacterium]